MSAKRSFASIVLVAVTTFAASAQTATSAQPEPKLRSFILILASTTFDDCPDIDSVDSLFLIAHSGKDHNPSATPVRVGFATCDGAEHNHVSKFDGTTWYFGGYLSHVTTAGVETYIVLWQDEVPPSGATALTGPDGLVLIENYWLRIAAAGECDTTNGDWLAEDFPTANSRPFCYGMGLFSK